MSSMRRRWRGDTLPERPELPGLAVRLESAERFVAATGAVIVYGRIGHATSQRLQLQRLRPQ
jgi:hypothetical protein